MSLRPDFVIYYLGAENTRWRQLMADEGIENVGINWYATQRKHHDFSAFTSVLLDSGGHMANSRPKKHTPEEWAAYGERYRRYALEHLDDFSIVTEFDCLVLGQDWIVEQRALWEPAGEKFMPVWHPEYGIAELHNLGARYRRIALTQDTLEGTENLAPVLNSLANRGVLFHGLAMSKPGAVRDFSLSSAGSTTWLSGSKWGETQWWDGTRLIRYNARQKHDARTRHRADFERAGFDVARIDADDPIEINRLSLWSWQRYEESLRVTPTLCNGRADAESTTSDVVGGGVERDGSSGEQRERRLLPVFGLTEQESINADGTNERLSLPVINQETVRSCDSCFVRAECPSYQPRAACTYVIPVEVRTPEQRRALLNGLVEMQTQRLAFMRFREELAGGYADPNLSREYDRLLKTFQVLAEIEDQRDFFKMTVESRGKAGVLSRLFGQAPESIPLPPGQQLDGQGVDRFIRGQVVREHAS